MNRLSHQPKALLAAIALGLGFAVVGAGCTQSNDAADTTSSMAGAATSNHSAGTSNADRMGADNNHANADTNGDMSTGAGNSNQPVSDTWITTKVKAKLATTDGVDNSDIDVETNNGVVTLTGTAASHDAVQAMTAAAKDVKGVTQVNNAGLQVGSGSSDSGSGAASDNDEHVSAGTGNSHEPVKDTWVTTKVLGVLQTVDGLDNTDIGVETNNGVVTLTGHVDSQKMADAAVAEIKTVEGVKDVDTSRLDVGGGQ